MNTVRGCLLALLGFAFTVEATSLSAAASLAGSEGDVVRRPFFSIGDTGGCKGFYQKYIAAGGHSAYAATPASRGYSVCGMAMNLASQNAAEKQALKNCETGLKRWKVGAVPICTIRASK